MESKQTKILVGSKNPLKIAAAKEAFDKYFDSVEVYGFDVKSGVSPMPINNEVYDGAENRSRELEKINKINKLNADYFIGIEGGIAKIFDKWFTFGSICIVDKNGNCGYGTSPHFQLPPSVIEQLLKGIELGDVMDKLSNTHNSKQKFGAIGFFTNGKMNRKELYVHGLISAIIPFLRKDLYFKK